MIIQSPRLLSTPLPCAECGAPTRRPFYQFIGTDYARALCARCAAAVSAQFTVDVVLDQARGIIRQHQLELWGAE